MTTSQNHVQPTTPSAGHRLLVMMRPCPYKRQAYLTSVSENSHSWRCGRRFLALVTHQHQCGKLAQCGRRFHGPWSLPYWHAGRKPSARPHRDWDGFRLAARLLHIHTTLDIPGRTLPPASVTVVIFELLAGRSDSRQPIVVVVIPRTDARRYTDITRYSKTELPAAFALTMPRRKPQVGEIRPARSETPQLPQTSYKLIAARYIHDATGAKASTACRLRHRPPTIRHQAAHVQITKPSSGALNTRGL